MDRGDRRGVAVPGGPNQNLWHTRKLIGIRRPSILLAPSEEVLQEIRRRLKAEGATDGDVRDMKSMWIMGYLDPDGAAHEVMLRRPDVRESEVLERVDKTTVTLDDSG